MREGVGLRHDDEKIVSIALCFEPRLIQHVFRYEAD